MYNVPFEHEQQQDTYNKLQRPSFSSAYQVPQPHPGSRGRISPTRRSPRTGCRVCPSSLTVRTARLGAPLTAALRYSTMAVAAQRGLDTATRAVRELPRRCRRRVRTILTTRPATLSANCTVHTTPLSYVPVGPPTGGPKYENVPPLPPATYSRSGELLL